MPSPGCAHFFSPCSASHALALRRYASMYAYRKRGCISCLSYVRRLTLAGFHQLLHHAGTFVGSFASSCTMTMGLLTSLTGEKKRWKGREHGSLPAVHLFTAGAVAFITVAVAVVVITVIVVVWLSLSLVMVLLRKGKWSEL